MFPALPKEDPAGSSSHNEQHGHDEAVHSRKGHKPTLAERNRERQQRFRQRQKSRIEELESRCQRLSSQARTLATEKEELTKSVSILKNIVQVRDLQLVAVTTQLAQLTSPNGEVKQEASSQEDAGNLEALLQPPTLQALKALQAAAHPEALIEVAQEGPSSTSTESQEPLSHRIGGGSPVSTPRPRPRSHSPPAALDQLCRVAEMEEQRAASPGPANSGKLEQPGAATESLLAGNETPLFAHLSPSFEGAVDVALVIEGQRLAVHSSMLAAHSNAYARKLLLLRHAQPLYSGPHDPVLLDTGVPGKRLEDVLLFLRHCYGVLDLGPVADADIMRLVMLADEFEAPALLQRCDAAIVARSQGRSFSFFVELSQGGDVVDWIRLADRLGLKRVSGVCELHLARYLKENRTWRSNTRLNELGQECLLRVINKLAEL